ncbi:uncharacterized protein LOC136033152 isoform X3 [Artemia franciscana]|uniref:uncharacterized protein LOC136033152 isoform X3 n=1 Tax=Artemia franciscana TaxID=6661 RepID=UPI0032D9E53D
MKTHVWISILRTPELRIFTNGKTLFQVKVTGWAGGAVLLIGSFGLLFYKLFSYLSPKTFKTLTEEDSLTSTPASRRKYQRRRRHTKTRLLEEEQDGKLTAIVDIANESDEELIQTEYFRASPLRAPSEDEPLSPLSSCSKYDFSGAPYMPRCFSTPAGFLISERSEGDGISASQLVHFDEDIWSDRASSTEFWSVKPDDGAIQMRTSPDGTDRSRSRSQSMCENDTRPKRILRRQEAVTMSDVSTCHLGSSESLLSELDSMVGSVEFNLKEKVGKTTMNYFDRLEAEVNNLRANCLEMDQEIEHLADDESDEKQQPRMSSNVSSWSLSSFSSDMSIDKKPQFRGHFSMTTVGASLLIDSDSPDSSLVTTSPTSGSMEWDSPVHGWSSVSAKKHYEATIFEIETLPSTTKSNPHTGEETDNSWEWDNDGLEPKCVELEETLVPSQVSIEIDAVDSECGSRSRSSTKSPSPITVRSMSITKSPGNPNYRHSTLGLPERSPQQDCFSPLSRSGSQPSVSSRTLLKLPKKWVSLGDSVEASEFNSENGSSPFVLTPLSESRSDNDMSQSSTMRKTYTCESLMSTAETLGSFCPSMPSSENNPRSAMEVDRDSAYDGVFDMISDISQEAVGSRVDIMAYAETIWQGQTERAKTTKKGFGEVVIRTGCTRMRRFRGDSYSLLRATVFAALTTRQKLPSAAESLNTLRDTLKRRKQVWLLNWSFANRLPYGRENVEEGWKECLNCLENIAVDLNHEADIEESLVHSLSADCELDTRLVEAAKLHVLASVLEPFATDPNGNYDTTRSYTEQYLDTVGDTSHLAAKDLHLVARALRLNLCLLKPSAYGTTDFATVASAGSDNSLVTLIAEDDRYFCVPVL